MKHAVKILLLAIFCISVAACKKEQVREEPEPVVDTRPTVTEPVVDRVDPNDYTNPENLSNPESLLSKRVIYFDFDQSTIRSEFRDVLRAHGRFLSSNSNYSVTLEGHADERGTREYNLALGERRSGAVANVLDAEGASNTQLESVSYGEERPLCTASNESCWQRNRRVEISYTQG